MVAGELFRRLAEALRGGCQPAVRWMGWLLGRWAPEERSEGRGPRGFREAPTLERLTVRGGAFLSSDLLVIAATFLRASRKDISLAVEPFPV